MNPAGRGMWMEEDDLYVKLLEGEVRRLLDIIHACGERVIRRRSEIGATIGFLSQGYALDAIRAAGSDVMVPGQLLAGETADGLSTTINERLNDVYEELERIGATLRGTGVGRA